jgi:hypothetical protein
MSAMTIFGPGENLCPAPVGDGNSRRKHLLAGVFFCILRVFKVFMEAGMSKTVTLRLDVSIYRLFREVADRENRPISNFIETTVVRFLREHEHVDEFEMAEIRGNAELNRSLKRGHQDAKQRRGAFV